MNATIDHPLVRESMRASMARFLSAERIMSAEAAAELDLLLRQLMPLVVEQTRALAEAATPQVAAAYLEVLEGTVQATIARLGLQALAVQRRRVASLVSSAVQILAAVLRAGAMAA